MANVPTVLILFLSLLLFPTFVLSRETFEFVFNGFNGTNLTLNGASVVKSSGALKLTNVSDDYIGHAFYPDPVRMFPTNFQSSNVSSFSTQFVFAIRPSSSHGQGGYGLAFVIAPSTKFPGAEAEHYLGLFNSSNDNDRNNHMFLVEFDTVNGYNSNVDYKGNHVGIDVNGMSSIATEPAGYYKDGDSNNEEITLESGEPIQAWIDYDGERQLVNVTIAPIKEAKPLKPLLSETVNLTDILLGDMYVGFSAATGKTTSFHYVLGWSFKLNGTAPPLNLTLLPLPPIQDQDSSSYNPKIIAVIAVLSAVALLLIVILAISVVVRLRRQHEIIEEWELDCPRRFQYRDLHQATRGFNKTKLIGTGGFGAVYLGVLPLNGCEVAVKKISQNSIQGMREFVAEIESLGRLRHKNLVHLQGWCKRKVDLLLVYDYIPYGSLDSLLFKQKDGFILSWDQRFHIIGGIVAGLLYLHEEWEKVVIHRDVKSSNVLIDAEMNARLGDFGLARLYEPGTTSHTTNIMGTVGYIAPELARSGKASTSTDVYAFGVMLLEVATGKRPVGSGNFLLVEWVVECNRLGEIQSAADPRLNSEYNNEEMELVLRLGLLCTHDNAHLRPSMRQVMRYLNRDEPLPLLPDWRYGYSTRSEEIRMKFFEIISSDTFTGSQNSSSLSNRLFSSLGPGR